MPPVRHVEAARLRVAFLAALGSLELQKALFVIGNPAAATPVGDGRGGHFTQAGDGRCTTKELDGIGRFHNGSMITIVDIHVSTKVRRVQALYCETD
jgi:hypothetical protein